MATVTLRRVNAQSLEDARVLYDLLKERKPEQSISHTAMPTWNEHLVFMGYCPYEAWYIIEADGEDVGSIYITGRSELGVFIFERHHRKGYASAAVEMMMEWHERPRFLANVNPKNQASVLLWKKFGFEMLQVTYARDRR